MRGDGAYVPSIRHSPPDHLKPLLSSTTRHIALIAELLKAFAGWISIRPVAKVQLPQHTGLVMSLRKAASYCGNSKSVSFSQSFAFPHSIYKHFELLGRDIAHISSLLIRQLPRLCVAIKLQCWSSPLFNFQRWDSMLQNAVLRPMGNFVVSYLNLLLPCFFIFAFHSVPFRLLLLHSTS